MKRLAKAALCATLALQTFPAVAWKYQSARGMYILVDEFRNMPDNRQFFEEQTNRFIDGILEANNGNMNRRVGRCFDVPENIPDKAIYAIVRSFVDALPDEKPGRMTKDVPAFIAVTFALANAFPCREVTK